MTRLIVPVGDSLTPVLDAIATFTPDDLLLVASAKSRERAELVGRLAGNLRPAPAACTIEVVDAFDPLQILLTLGGSSWNPAGAELVWGPGTTPMNMMVYRWWQQANPKGSAWHKPLEATNYLSDSPVVAPRPWTAWQGSLQEFCTVNSGLGVRCAEPTDYDESAFLDAVVELSAPLTNFTPHSSPKLRALLGVERWEARTIERWGKTETIKADRVRGDAAGDLLEQLAARLTQALLPHAEVKVNVTLSKNDSDFAEVDVAAYHAGRLLVVSCGVGAGRLKELKRKHSELESVAPRFGGGEVAGLTLLHPRGIDDRRLKDDVGRQRRTLGVSWASGERRRWGLICLNEIITPDRRAADKIQSLLTAPRSLLGTTHPLVQFVDRAVPGNQAAR